MAIEATGKFHRPAHRSLHADGFAVAVVNPLRSRLFAEAVGALAKTDRVDCRMLAILAESLEPNATAPPSEFMESLQDLVRCRDAALAARTALINQLGPTAAQRAIIENQAPAPRAETAIENLGADIERLIASDPGLARRMAILTSIPGVGTITVVALIVGLAEIGSLSAKQAAMISGLAPIAWDSGQNTARAASGADEPTFDAPSIWPQSPPPASAQPSKSSMTACSPTGPTHAVVAWLPVFAAIPAFARPASVPPDPVIAHASATVRRPAMRWPAIR